MAKKAEKYLVIVESPAKAKTIGKYLGPAYQVKACMGHLRDLPKSKLGVDVENDFEPNYRPIKGKEDIIRDLKQAAKENGITRSEIAEILTHAAFYAGWPKAWAAFRMAKDIWTDVENTDEKQRHQNSMVFPIGAPNDGFAQYFSGQSYLAPVSTEQVKIFNVTFEPGYRNNWHIHEADKGGGQILICVAGRGYYQEWGKEPQELHPGDVINIMPGVKHWHGAAPDSWFSHLAVEAPGENCRSQWCEPVSEEEYRKLK